MIHDAAALLKTLCSSPAETEWLEFKQDYFHRDEAAKYVSALANSAMLANEQYGYLVYGVQDSTHEVVGTKVRLATERVGNEPFESWLVHMLSPCPHLEFATATCDGKHVEIVRIHPAYERPVAVRGKAFLRVGSATKELSQYPARERSLWDITSRYCFEQGIAASHVAAEQILEDYACSAFFRLLDTSDRAVSPGTTIDRLLQRQLILDNKQGRFDVTNLYALLAAKDLTAFPHLRDKAPRVVVYEGTDRIVGKSDVVGKLGYAAGFLRILKYVMGCLPQREEMTHGVRIVQHALPEIAVRELIANAMIHQDMTVGGGPLIEVFSDRVAITNAGEPIVPVERFIDTPSRSRNGRLALMMRDLHLCEERGSGVDRALQAIEQRALPAPLFEAPPESTVVTVFPERGFAFLTKTDRMRACYQHACICQQANTYMSNGSLRIRMGLSQGQYAQVSRLIADTIEAGLIKPLEEGQPNRTARYIPSWFHP